MKNYTKSINLFIVLCLFSLFAWSQTTYQAENGTLTTGVSKATYLSTSVAYMQGTGSVKITANVAQKGYYKLVITASTPNGNKDQDLLLNGGKISTLKFPSNAAFFDFNGGNLLLNAGNNTIEVAANWGWMYFDKFTITQVPPHNYSITDANLINPNANQKAKDVFAFLRSNYGKNIISGQTAYWNELITLAGKTPVIRAFEFQHYTVGYSYLWKNGGHTFGWEDDGTTKAAIDWYNSTGKKGIVTFQWHWHSPSGGAVSTNTFYTNSTTFDVGKAVISGTAENVAIIRDIDSIATQLKRLQVAGVPVLWRPLHEAGGAWFWWGAKGSANCLKLYDILYDRLTNFYQLNNLIWVWSSPEADWYPGNTKVDIIGYDSYPGAYDYGSQKSVFDQLFDIVQGKKMVTMSENGPIPDINKCIDEDAMWLYFSSWVDLVASQNTKAHVQEVYAHAKVITLDEMPTIITSLENTETESGFKLFPNPAENRLYVENSDANDFEILDLTGKIVMNGLLENGNNSIDIANLEKGTYLISFSGQTKRKSIFVKK